MTATGTATSSPNPAAAAELLAAASEVTPGGVHSARRRTTPPFSVARGHGQYLWGVDGRRYTDYRAGAGAVILGHGFPVVADAVDSASRNGILFAVGTTDAERQLAEKIVRHLPSVDQVLFCNSGSEASYNAIRLARAFTGRKKILKFQGCYHGSHDYVLLNCTSTHEMLGRPDPHSAGILPEAVDATLVARFNDLQDVTAVVDRAHGDLAAIIVEPISHNGPGIIPKPGFLEGLRELCDQVGALLIFDEVITGFRHHLGGYQAICGVSPDLTLLGKALANGYPIAAVGGRHRLMQHFTTNPGGDTMWIGTYNSNAACVAAALATISVLERPGTYEHLYSLGDMMRAGLRDLVQRLSVPATVCGYGSLFSLWFAPGPIDDYDAVVRHDLSRFLLYRAGLVERGTFEYPDIDGVRSHISLSHTEDDIALSLTHAEEALRAVLGSSQPKSAV